MDKVKKDWALLIQATAHVATVWQKMRKDGAVSEDAENWCMTGDMDRDNQLRYLYTFVNKDKLNSYFQQMQNRLLSHVFDNEEELENYKNDIISYLKRCGCGDEVPNGL